MITIKLAAKREGWEEGKEYIGISTAHSIEEKILQNKPQLLITGIISSEISDVATLINMLRKKNPQLVTISFSAVNLTGDYFDKQIPKFEEGSCDKLMDCIRDFKSGKLRRSLN